MSFETIICDGCKRKIDPEEFVAIVETDNPGGQQIYWYCEECNAKRRATL